MSRVLHDESFRTGPGAWRMGKADPNGHWHKNIFGEHGTPAPVGWTGGDSPHAYTEGPWYFDDNHGELFWLYLAFFLNRSADGGLDKADLRGATIELTLRAPTFRWQGTSLYLWIQGNRANDPMLINWCLYTQPITGVGSEWTTRTIKLVNDEHQWRPMGLLNGGLSRRLMIIQSTTAAAGSLGDILDGRHINFGFVLGDVDPVEPPTGRIEVKRVVISA